MRKMVNVIKNTALLTAIASVVLSIVLGFIGAYAYAFMDITIVSINACMDTVDAVSLITAIVWAVFDLIKYFMDEKEEAQA